MGFLDTLGETFASTGRAIGNKTKEVAGATKISFQINQEEVKLKKAYMALGEAYYKDHAEDMPEAYAMLAADIKNSKEQLENLIKDKQILTNQKQCTSCGAWMANEDRFCGKCGAENEVAGKDAAEENESCQQEKEDAAFGDVNAAPEEAFCEEKEGETECPACHAKIKGGLFYCPECGQKLS